MYNYHIILDLEMNPVAKDNPKAYKLLRKEVIEIGAVKLDKDFNIIDRFNVFVKPQYNHQVTPYITKLTGIVSSVTMNAEYFEEALKEFANWVGNSGVIRIYSWSNNDLDQLKTECSFKEIEFPSNLKRWLDVQKIFPRMMCLSNDRRQMALREAIQYFDIKVDDKKIHNALYDSEITTELLIYLLNGEYKKQVECMRSFTQTTENKNTIGDLYGGELAEFLRQLQLETT